MSIFRRPHVVAQTILRIASLAAIVAVCGKAAALPPLPEPYPTQLPVRALPEPVASVGSLADLPAPLPIPLSINTPRSEELDAAGAEQPGNDRVVSAILVENTPDNRSWLKKYLEKAGGRAKKAGTKYIWLDVYAARKYGAERAQVVGKILGHLGRVYAIHEVHQKTGSREQAFHQFVREAFKFAGGAWAGGAAATSGVGIGWVRAAQFVGVEIGGGVAEVVIWSGVNLGDGARSAYDFTKQQIRDTYTDFRSWWQGGDDLPPPLSLPDDPVDQDDPKPHSSSPPENGGDPSDPTTPPDRDPKGPITPPDRDPKGPITPPDRDPNGPWFPDRDPKGPITPPDRDPKGPITPPDRDPKGPWFPERDPIVPPVNPRPSPGDDNGTGGSNPRENNGKTGPSRNGSHQPQLPPIKIDRPPKWYAK